ncbi:MULTISPECIES: thioesterase II family protein [Actinosynnema]|uniref:thioesterase II family protein n=1 Tax=Actinosynnema TaxID=40566 RepID=UPI0020A2B01A|nr:alpha/beta fold hydrolase [Actinosynnema pretiosum]MCP2097806.1 Surfactin synthase thioesterase subunit [Actinosynnema pretiosum]
MTITTAPGSTGGHAELPWFVPLTADRRPRQVLALPQAGGGCATFAGCAAGVGPDTAVWGLNLPGRQARFGEPARTDLDGLVDDIVAGLSAHADGRYDLVGYCSGALLAYLVACQARKAGMRPCANLVVISYPAAHVADPPRELHALPEEGFWAEMISYGGIAPELAGQPDYREVLGPALRGDHELFADFRFPDEPPLDVPIVVIAGRHDPLWATDALPAWSELTTASFTLHLLDGDHWLLDSAEAEIAGILERLP